MGFYRDHSKMAVLTPFGIFVPSRLGFGGSNGPAYMRRLSDYVYGDLEDVCVYIVDILIASSDWTSHLESLREVFQRTRDAKLRMVLKKSSLHFLILTMWDSISRKMGSNLKRFIRIPSYNLLSLRR